MVQRWKHIEAVLVKSIDGEYVDYADYKKLEAENKRLAAEVREYDDEAYEYADQVEHLTDELQEWLEQALKENSETMTEGPLVGWWGLNGSGTANVAGHRLVSMGVWEMHPERNLYRPKTTKEHQCQTQSS